ncbi:MAG: nucleoside recognition domain-containing protein [Bacilli bacterium]
MNIVSISNMIIPIIILIIIFYGFKKKVNVYDTFVDGAKEGMELGVSIFPYLLGMIIAINIFLKSNILEYTFSLIKPFFDYIKLPIEILPMVILRSVSGSSTLVIMTNIFKDYGPDSFLGRLASTIQGCTDTTIYVLTLYFGSVGIKKIKHALWAGLFADLIGIIASIIFVSLIFY